jgi:large subunit ribosomal protein L31
VKADIHPKYVDTHVSCTCGNEFTTRSTVSGGDIRAEVCAACHPFYTGKQKILDTGGRVARFEQRFGKRSKSRPCGARPLTGVRAPLLCMPLARKDRDG